MLRVGIHLFSLTCSSAGIYLGKAIMEARLGGKHCGPPRHPLSPMTPEGTAKLHADLKAIGFFEY